MRCLVFTAHNVGNANFLGMYERLGVKAEKCFAL